MDITQPFIIKKYPNRRLYDTSQSKYVNLEYIHQLIIDRRDFQVLDSKTGDDLTKSVLLQIISESETSDAQSLLTDTLLKQLICFYGSDMQSFVPQYLEDSLTSFLQQQDTVRGMVKDLVSSGPLGLFGKLVERNMETWNRLSRHDRPSKNDDKN